MTLNDFSDQDRSFARFWPLAVLLGVCAVVALIYVPSPWSYVLAGVLAVVALLVLKGGIAFLLSLPLIIAFLVPVTVASSFFYVAIYVLFDTDPNLWLVGGLGFVGGALYMLYRFMTL